MTFTKALLLTATMVVGSAAHAAEEAWIEESNRDAQILIAAQAKYIPEQVAMFGVTGYDGAVMDLKPANSERQQAELLVAQQQLEGLRAKATDARVRQDLDILIDSAKAQQQTLEINRKLMVPYFDLGQMLFGGFQKLVHEGLPRERQQQALVRLRRYAGHESGYTPIAELARQRIAETMQQPGLAAPWNLEVQQALDNQPRYLKGIRDLFAHSGLRGWEGDFKRLSGQMEAYAAWLKSDVLPRARTTNQLPEAVYADNLKNFGVFDDPRLIMREALTAYTQIREEMTVLAGVVAQQRDMKATAYQDVIRELKKNRIPQDKLLAIYSDRLAQIEKTIRDNHLVTLPNRAAAIRLGTEAESAATPAPHIDMPPLIGNTGQPAAFVVPVSNPNATSTEDYDDFSFDAVSWTLIAHECRPGHELQISRTLEHGVSIARAMFAFNSANVEGWALYAEAFLKPYEPLDAQLGVLQLRLMRSARAFLDPMLNLGMITPEAAKRILMEEVVLSEPMAKQEVDRYTFNAPGQATAYFYGSQILQATRAKAEIALGKRFDLLSFHDFIMGQGLLPLSLLQKAVMEEYVPGRMK